MPTDDMKTSDSQGVRSSQVVTGRDFDANTGQGDSETLGSASHQSSADPTQTQASGSAASREAQHVDPGKTYLVGGVEVENFPKASPEPSRTGQEAPRTEPAYEESQAALAHRLLDQQDKIINMIQDLEARHADEMSKQKEEYERRLKMQEEAYSLLLREVQKQAVSREENRRLLGGGLAEIATVVLGHLVLPANAMAAVIDRVAAWLRSRLA